MEVVRAWQAVRASCTAAAMAVKAGVTVRNVDIKALQQKLIENSGIL